MDPKDFGVCILLYNTQQHWVFLIYFLSNISIFSHRTWKHLVVFPSVMIRFINHSQPLINTSLHEFMH